MSDVYLLPAPQCIYAVIHKVMTSAVVETNFSSHECPYPSQFNTLLTGDSQWYNISRIAAFYHKINWRKMIIFSDVKTVFSKKSNRFVKTGFFTRYRIMWCHIMCLICGLTVETTQQ